MLDKLSTLAARFDAVALRPFEWPVGGVGAEPWPALQHWCWAQGGAPLALAAAVTADQPATAHAAARAAEVALLLDGTHALQACSGAAARLALRLRVKLQDASAGFALRPGEVWDSGHVPAMPAVPAVRAAPSALAALARFQPRRATFIVIAGHPPQALQPVLAALHSRSPGFRRPVRVLLLGLPADVLAALAPQPVQALPL